MFSPKKITRLLITGVLIFPAILSARAETITFEIPDLLLLGTGTITTPGGTWSGTGFVQNAPQRDKHQGVFEMSNRYHTALNVDISSLAGATIDSATLSFRFVDQRAFQAITVTSFAANGSLGWFWDPPSNLGTMIHVLPGTVNNEIEVTDLLIPRVAEGAEWFGLHLRGSVNWNYTSTSESDEPDRAQVRLIVDYEPARQPSPESIANLQVEIQNGQAIVTWASGLQDFILEQSGDLANWVPIEENSISDDSYIVPGGDEGTTYFRLRFRQVAP